MNECELKSDERESKIVSDFWEIALQIENDLSIIVKLVRIKSQLTNILIDKSLRRTTRDIFSSGNQLDFSDFGSSQSEGWKL